MFSISFRCIFETGVFDNVVSNSGFSRHSSSSIVSSVTSTPFAAFQVPVTSGAIEDLNTLK